MLDGLTHLGGGDYLHWTMEVRLFGVGTPARLRGLAIRISRLSKFPGLLGPSSLRNVCGSMLILEVPIILRAACESRSSFWRL